MTAKTSYPNVPNSLTDVALIDAPTAAATGGMSVSWWLDAVASGKAPAPVIRRPRCTRWRLTAVAEFYRVIAAQAGDSDQAKITLARMADGEYRGLAKPGSQWRADFDGLVEQYPNARGAVEFLVNQLALSTRGKRHWHFSPICLLGPPGIGKSVLVEAIAAVLRAPLARLQVETSSHASALVGTDIHWSSAGSGLLFDTLVDGQHANPIVMLDELEKVQQRDDYPSIHRALYGLWEQSSAQSFRDACLPQVPIDASYVRWIATANSLKGIPEPILSRMTVIEVPSLTPEQSLRVTHNINDAIRKEHRLKKLPSPSPAAMEQLAKHSPRVIQRMLRQAYGRMLSMKRPKASDQAIDVQFDQEPSTESLHQTQRQNVGLQELLALTASAAIQAIRLQRELDNLQVSYRRVQFH